MITFVCAIIASLAVVVITLVTRSKLRRGDGRMPPPTFSQTRPEGILFFVSLGGVLIGLWSFLEAFPTRSRHSFQPIPPFALPCLAIGLCAYALMLILEERRLSSSGSTAQN